MAFERQKKQHMKKNLFWAFVLALLVSACSDYDQIGNQIYWDEPPYSGENYTDYGENPFVDVSESPVSTFSIDADGGAYSNMRRFANLGQRPPTAAVRIEEFVNYFNFDYTEPTSENVALHAEMSLCPWNTEHNLIRIGLKGKSLDQRPPSNFVFLIDVSGSMNAPEKLGILKTGFKALTDQLTAQDRVALVTYAGSAGVVLNSTPGNEKEIIKNAIDQLGAGGSTAGAEGIITAYQIAQAYFIQGGNNRVIIGSDGDFNVGPSSTDELVELIEEKRESGIFLSVLGVGSGNFNDAMMEQLANNGNGTYEYIDNAEQIKKVFIYEYDKFFTVAKDAKIQVTFDELAISKYRLIGYENRLLDEEDFENDTTDAGEIGASQCITALYEIVPRQNAKGEVIATLDFRYKFPDQDQSRLLQFTIANQNQNFEQASENMRFAAAVAGLGLLLKNSQYMGTLTFDDVIQWAENARSFDPFGFREEFVQLARTLKDAE